MSLNVVNKTDGSLTQVAGTAGTAASRITFDDTSSSLGSSNVQGAIDNLTTIVNTKQAATDNTLTTTAKTVSGAINELKSGLTNYQTQNDINLEVPSRKNLIAMTVDGIKALNTDGTWNGNDYTIRNITFSIQTDANGNVTGINTNASSAASGLASLTLNNVMTYRQSLILSGCPSGGGPSVYKILLVRGNGSSLSLPEDYGSGATIQTNNEFKVQIRIYEGQEPSNLLFKPMVRPATITDSTFAPYIPSVETRIKRLESNEKEYRLIKLVTADGVKTISQLFSELYSSVPSGYSKVKILYSNYIFSLTQRGSNHAIFATFLNYQGTMSYASADITASATNYMVINVSSQGALTVSDKTSDVVTSGAEIRLVY